MTWEQKLAAMLVLSGGTMPLVMVQPGNWMCCHPGEIGGDGLLRSVPQRAASPEAAVNATWDAILALPSDRYLEVNRDGARRRYRWGGFMWLEVQGPAGLVSRPEVTR